MTIDTLTDNVLLEIFVFCQNDCSYCTAWHSLVHVCRRWRQIIFASPNRLDLQILCTDRTPVRKSIGIWPPFPIAIGYPYPETRIASKNEDNIIAALEHPDRVRYLGLEIPRFQLKKMVTVMQDPFPVLASLVIILRDGYTGYTPSLPADFLGGSAPCLQKIHFMAIPFPSLPTLLLSASDLITLDLHEIPSNGYFSPEAMIAALAGLPMLQDLILNFKSANTQPDLTHPPSPITRVFLPALIRFHFRGASDYLEVLVAPIDGPRLIEINIHYLNHSVDYSVVQLSKFFDRSASLDIIPFTVAEVKFYFDTIAFNMHHANRLRGNFNPGSTHLSCRGIASRIPHLAQFLSQFSTILSTVVHLKLDVLLHGFEYPDAEWLHFLNQLSTVKALYISRCFAESVAPALENFTGEMVAEAWSSLELICLEGQPISSMEKFISARRLSGRLVTVIHTEEEFDQRLMSHVRDP